MECSFNQSLNKENVSMPVASHSFAVNILACSEKDSLLLCMSLSCFLFSCFRLRPDLFFFRRRSRYYVSHELLCVSINLQYQDNIYQFLQPLLTGDCPV